MPLCDLPPATAGVEGLKSSQLADGRPRLVNVFASWCIPCSAEAPQLEALKAAGVPIDGIAIRDRPEDVAMFLREYGNPFDRIGADRQTDRKSVGSGTRRQVHGKPGCRRSITKKNRQQK